MRSAEIYEGEFMKESDKKQMEQFYTELSRVYKEYKEGIASFGLKELSSEYMEGIRKRKVSLFMNPNGKLVLDVGCGGGRCFAKNIR